jgi:hypothetical protein
MMNKVLLALAVTANLFSPITIAKDTLSYTFVEIEHVSYDFNVSNSDGFTLKSSYAFNENLFGTIDYTSLSGDVDFNMLGYGIGFKHDLKNDCSLFASYSLSDLLSNWDYDSLESNNITFRPLADTDVLRLGYRHMMSAKVEMNFSLTFNEFEYRDSEFGSQIGIAYDMSDIQITADYEIVNGFDRIEILSVGVRYSF